MFTLHNCLFGFVNLTKNADPHKYKYSGYSIGFDSLSEFSFTDESKGKRVILFGANMNSCLHVDKKNRDILILGEGPIQGLDDIKLTGEAKYPINFTQPRKRFVLVYTIIEAAFSYLLILQKIYPFKAKRSETKCYALCLSNISKDFTINNMKKKNRIEKNWNFFCFDFNPIDTNNILDINIALMKKA